nr:hypothetical protein [Prochlorococcus marinus]
MRLRLFLLQGAITAGFFTFACLLLIEAPPRVSKFFSKNEVDRCDNISILDTTFIYGSCPNNTYLRKPGPDYPSMIATTSCTDSAGGRIDCLYGQRVFNQNNYNTYLIGDSFIQAEEIEYSKSVYGLINNSKTSPYRNSYGFGFSSWNTRQYLQAIKAINKKNSNYDIYLFANDITPRFERSTYGEVNRKTSTSKKDFLLAVKRLLTRSITVQKILQIRSKAAISPQLRKIRNDYWADHINMSFDKCPTSKTKKNIDSFSPLMRDYIMYSYIYDCWDDTQKEAYYLVKEDLKQILYHGNLLNSKVRIILFPAGFSFSDENVPGRLVEDTYYIPSNLSLSLNGLREKLSVDFKNSIIDLEDLLDKEIKEYKKRCERDCSNAYYFGHDGHFTSRGHEFLYRTLYAK